jgi:signal transduction histidine kinase
VTRPATPIRALLIEDNPGDARLIREMLHNARGTLVAVELGHADRLAAGLERLSQQDVDVVLLDLSLPDSQGLGTFTTVRAHAPDVAVVVLSGLDDETLAAVRAVHAERLGRVLRNLLGNAQKYGRENGTISFAVERDATEVCISVADDGPGIPFEDHERIFERFFRVSGSGSAGSGLGLAIARGLVELHGGRLWVDSTTGRGSTFRVALPVAER